MVNSNQIIFASVSLDTNTNGNESHVYISCKQIKYAVQTRATCVYHNEDQSLKLRNIASIILHNNDAEEALSYNPRTKFQNNL